MLLAGLALTLLDYVEWRPIRPVLLRAAPEEMRTKYLWLLICL